MPPRAAAKVFPGSTPFIEAAAAELGAPAPAHEVQRIAAVRVISVLAAQASDHPDPAELAAAARPHLAVLDAAAKAARAMVDWIDPPAEAANPAEAAKPAEDPAPTIETVEPTPEPAPSPAPAAKPAPRKPS